MRAQLLTISGWLAASLCFAGADRVEAANVVEAEKRWPSRKVEVLICDDRPSLRSAEICRPQKGGAGTTPRRLGAAEAKTIRAALKEWNSLFAGNLALQEVRSPSPNAAVVFRVSSRPGRCSATRVGYSPENQLNFISIGARCNLRGDNQRTAPGSVVHEIMHAIGFYHEQERSDRAEFLAIKHRRSLRVAWGIECRRRGAECTKGERGRLLGRYDFGSIMHYSAEGARAKGSRITRKGRTRLERAAVEARDLGQRERLSQLDIAAVRALYPARRTASASRFGRAKGQFPGS